MIPTPKIEVTRNIQMPHPDDGPSMNVSMYGLRWMVDEVEFGCSTYTPTMITKNNDHYEMMTIQHLLDEFIKWVNNNQGEEMKLIKTEHEITRASFQMREHDISILFLHTIDGGNTEYRAENFRGNIVKVQLNPKGSFHSWVLGVIKTELSQYAVVKV